MKEEILFWRKAKRLLKKHYGPDCDVRDVEEFPELKGGTSDRCIVCRKKEFVEFIDEHISIISE